MTLSQHGLSHRGKELGLGNGSRAVLFILALGALSSCATAPVTADLRPAYEAAREQEVTERLSCEGLSDLACQCRREGLEQEFADPSPARFDLGYAALKAYWDDPAHAGHTQAEAEAFAVDAIFTAITADVEDICSFYDQ
ncbi:MAG: hypothetical protein ACWA5T_11610 [Parvularcula sp.]